MNIENLEKVKRLNSEMLAHQRMTGLFTWCSNTGQVVGVALRGEHYTPPEMVQDIISSICLGALETRINEIRDELAGLGVTA